MPRFSRTSHSRLATCARSLQRLFQRVVERYDCTILDGHRGQQAQDRAHAEGRSKVRWPNGKHNLYPSRAVDVAPYPIEWGGALVRPDGRLNPENLHALLRFYHFAGYVQGTADAIGTPVRWGGDWDSDKEFDDQTFNDLVHFEVPTQEEKET